MSSPNAAYDIAGYAQTLYPVPRSRPALVIAPKNTVIRIETPDVRLRIDQVVTLSMTITEAIANALKHAFSADDGAGLPQGVTMNRRGASACASCAR